MSALFDPRPDQLAAWSAWVASRPKIVREMAERINPWTLYRLKTTDQRVTLVSFAEDRTVRVRVTSEHNGPWVVDREVFGINPDDLEPAAGQ